MPKRNHLEYQNSVELKLTPDTKECHAKTSSFCLSKSLCERSLRKVVKKPQKPMAGICLKRVRWAEHWVITAGREDRIQAVMTWLGVEGWVIWKFAWERVTINQRGKLRNAMTRFLTGARLLLPLVNRPFQLGLSNALTETNLYNDKKIKSSQTPYLSVCHLNMATWCNILHYSKLTGHLTLKGVNWRLRGLYK